MSGPDLAVQVEGRGRMYRHPVTGDLYPSITSIIDVIDKPALVGWAARETAKAAWNLRHAIQRLEDEGACVDMLKYARYRMTERRARVGTSVHEVAEALSNDAPLPTFAPEVEPYVDQFIRFVDDYDARFEVVEGTVFSDAHAYAGTFDFLMRLGDALVLGDYKTGKGVYPEVALQIAAARYAEWLWDRATGELRPMPEVRGAIAVHLQSDGYRVLSIGAGPEAFEAFCGARGLWPWIKGGGSDSGVGPAMSPQRLDLLLNGPRAVPA